MAAKVVLVFLALFVTVAIIVGWLYPKVLEYRERRAEREYKRELRQLERDEALVAEAERDVWDENDPP